MTGYLPVESPPEGWLVAQGTNVAHYFTDGKSRCGRWQMTVLDTPMTRESMRCNYCVEGVATDMRERSRASASDEKQGGDA